MTVTKAKKTAAPRKLRKTESTPPAQPHQQQAMPVEIDIRSIVPSPFNYRHWYSREYLDELALSLKKDGLLHPVKVRPLESGQYEIITGERRWRAGLIAEFTTMTAFVSEMNDDAVKELQLVENLQREDPHPLDEAIAFQQLAQNKKMSVQDIAARVGRSNAFVRKRLLLVTLLPCYHELFYSEKINITIATQIATLSEESQHDLYTDFFENRNIDNIDFTRFDKVIKRYTYSLDEVPFDLEDATLCPEAGACKGCRFNSATATSLFPDDEEDHQCLNLSCFNQKLTSHVQRSFAALLDTCTVQALIVRGSLTNRVEHTMQQYPALSELPTYNYYSVEMMHCPIPPRKEEVACDYEKFVGNDDEYEGDEDRYPEETDNDEMDEDTRKAMDEAEIERIYQEEVATYRAELEEFEQDLAASNIKTALYIDGEEIDMVYYKERQHNHSNERTHTAKDFAQAIKEGNVNAGMLANEKTRLIEREERSKELDQLKVAEAIHTLAVSTLKPGMQQLTTEDYVAARHLVFDAMNYSARDAYWKAVDVAKEAQSTWIDNMGESEFAFLIRFAVLYEDESKRPGTTFHNLLNRLCPVMQVDTASIVQNQQRIAASRDAKLAGSLAELDKRIAQMEEE